MKIQHLNYCRSMVKQFSAQAKENPYFDLLLYITNLAKTSQKFMLPDNGRLLADKLLRALDETVPLHLPFPCIALEYAVTNETAKEGEMRSTKRIVLAREKEFGIVLTPVVWSDDRSIWAPFPEVVVPSTNYLDRNVVVNGWVGMTIHAHEKNSATFPVTDYADELGALLSFLNALQCSNVRIERSASKPGNVKSALPFDDYHLLTIDTRDRQESGESRGGIHRSPREHLRRGHVRTLESGRKIWVNAAVISAGKGAGKVIKDYRLKPEPPTSPGAQP